MADPVIRDRTDNMSETAGMAEGPVMLVNIFTPKAGMADEFIRAQTAEYVRLRGLVKGHISNRLGRAVDGSNQLVNVALFDTMENYNAWRASTLFSEHLEIIAPLIQESAPGLYAVAYDYGA
jgi:heme-degrading monooxygenase HmoA